MNTFILNLKKYIKYHILDKLFSLLPVKNNKIVFQNFSGKGYGDNPKYVCEALRKTDKNLDIVWLTFGKKEGFPSGIRVVNYGSWKAVYELATAKVWVDNCRTGIRAKKRKKQLYIQTWHGGLGIKKVEGEIVDRLSKKYIEIAQADSKITDILISSSRWQTEQMKKFFWYNGEILECGLPRNDILITNSPDIKKRVYETLGIEENKKIILFAPTFRMGKENEVILPNYKKIVEACNLVFESKYDFVLRLHPNCTNVNIDGLDIIDASKYSDVQELIIASDLLITDYSSLMFDFMIMEKKVLLYTPDLTEYLTNERELAFQITTLPFLLSETEEELLRNIDVHKIEEKQQCTNAWLVDLGFVMNNKASNIVANRILEFMNLDK